MKTIKFTLLIALALLNFACNYDDTNYQESPTYKEEKVMAIETSALQVQTISHPQTNEIMEANCFLINLIDPMNNEIVGTLEDCIIDSVNNADGSITSRVISTISLDGRGTLVFENELFQTPTDTEGVLTTSSIPVDNNIIYGTQEFEGIVGRAFLNGEMDVTLIDLGIVTFNYNFGIAASY